MNKNKVLTPVSDFEISDDSLIEYIGSAKEVVVPEGIKEIREYAFADSSITSIQFPDGVETINSFAFKDCVALKEVIFSSTITEIWKNAFENCIGLKKIELLEGLNCIDEDVFQGCCNLESIRIPNTIRYIAETFEGCSKLKYNEYDNGYYLGNEDNPYFLFVKTKDKYIKACKLHDHTKFIGDYSFKNCTNLEKLYIPNSVELIGDFAFDGCKSLKTVSIPCNLDMSWGWYIFRRCKQLKYNEYDNGYYLGNEENPYFLLVEAKDRNIKTCEIHPDTCHIYYYAFEDCTKLDRINIPKSVTNIMDLAFYRCDHLKEVYCEFTCEERKQLFTIHKEIVSKLIYYSEKKPKDNHRYWHYVDGNKIIWEEGVNMFIFEEDNNEEFIIEDRKLIEYIGNKSIVHIPEGVEVIGELAFGKVDQSSRERITHIILPSTLRVIEQSAFRDCVLLKKIHIPNSVEYIGDTAFLKCRELKDIVLPNKIKDIKENTFACCFNLESIVIPKSVHTIHKSAFINCEKLKNIFTYDVNMLKDVVFTQGVTIHLIKEQPIDNVKKTKTKKDKEFEIKDSVLVQYLGNKRKVVIPEGVTKINKDAFIDATNVVSIALPSSLEAIEDEAFSNSFRIVEIYNLSNLEIRPGIEFAYEHGGIGSNVKVIHTSLEEESRIFEYENFVFYKDGQGSYFLIKYIGDQTKLILPQNVFGNSYQLNDYAFYDNANLTSIILPDTIKEISKSAFEFCVELKKVKLGKYVQKIGNSAFLSCRSLESIELPNTLLSIESSAFVGCRMLKKILFPESLESIGAHAFIDCNSLINIKIPKNVGNIGENAFWDCQNLQNIYTYDKTMVEDSFVEDIDLQDDYYAAHFPNVVELSETQELDWLKMNTRKLKIQCISIGDLAISAAPLKEKISNFNKEYAVDIKWMEVSSIDELENKKIKDLDMVFVLIDFKNEKEIIDVLSIINELSHQNYFVHLICKTSSNSISKINEFKDISKTIILYDKDTQMELYEFVPMVLGKLLETVSVPGMIGMDHIDVAHLLKQGTFYVGYGCEECNRTKKAVDNALASPQIIFPIETIKRAFIIVTGPNNLHYNDIEATIRKVRLHCDKDVECIYQIYCYDDPLLTETQVLLLLSNND